MRVSLRRWLPASDEELDVMLTNPDLVNPSSSSDYYLRELVDLDSEHLLMLFSGDQKTGEASKHKSKADIPRQ
ncbi:hypothetical protein FRB95_014778 [Tulasnella sp. JGI-2019a]|nr:hypothetical protein FRB93_010629 [Tulasnella sp. JGI-2019a]KAG9022448.1 hypothetical protein FRB95_014778 [Tulasnella sp. JGI-2019a]